jgi:hypothetical protein
MYTKKWFEDHEGQTVTRCYDDHCTDFVITKENAGYLALFALKGYTFRLKPRIHQGPPESACLSCES